MLADAFRGVQFLVYREADLSLTLLGQDVDYSFCMSAGFILDGPMLGMVVGDDEGNMKLLQYSPK